MSAESLDDLVAQLKIDAEYHGDHTAYTTDKAIDAIEALRADAERYRFLKAERPSAIAAICYYYKEACTDEVNDKGIDAIVDAARLAEKDKNG